MGTAHPSLPGAVRFTCKALYVQGDMLHSLPSCTACGLLQLGICFTCQRVWMGEDTCSFCLSHMQDVLLPQATAAADMEL